MRRELKRLRIGADIDLKERTSSGRCLLRDAERPLELWAADNFVAACSPWTLANRNFGSSSRILSRRASSRRRPFCRADNRSRFVRVDAPGFITRWSTTGYGS